MGEILLKEGDLVLPGETIAKGMDLLPSKATYRQGEEIISTLIGVFKLRENIVNVVPLYGPYYPRSGDQVIGKVADIGHTNWSVDIGTPYPAVLFVRDGVSEFVDLDKVKLTKYYKRRDVIVARVLNKEDSTFIKISTRGPGLRKLNGGKLIQISPSKIPRVIGKEGSMVNMIKNKTNTNIIAGQNGFVWIGGEPLDELRAAEAIELIENQAHTQGLTEKIEKFLGEEK